MTLETALWLGALAAAVDRHPAYMTPELARLAEALLRRRRARTKA